MEEIQTWFYMTGDNNFTRKLSIIWLHLANRRKHKKSITWRYAAQTLSQQVTVALIRLRPPQFFPIYTSSNWMHFIWCWTHLSYTYVQLISEVQMLLWCSLPVQYIVPLTVSRAPCCRGFNTFNVKLSLITVCLPVNFKLCVAEESSEKRLCHW